MSTFREWLANLAASFEAKHQEEPWVLAVKLDTEHFSQAAHQTTALLSKDWGRYFGSDFQRKNETLVLAGERHALIMALAYYAGGWPSAQIDFRPASAFLAEG